MKFDALCCCNCNYPLHLSWKDPFLTSYPRVDRPCLFPTHFPSPTRTHPVTTNGPMHGESKAVRLDYVRRVFANKQHDRQNDFDWLQLATCQQNRSPRASLGMKATPGDSSNGHCKHQSLAQNLTKITISQMASQKKHQATWRTNDHPNPQAKLNTKFAALAAICIRISTETWTDCNGKTPGSLLRKTPHKYIYIYLYLYIYIFIYLYIYISIYLYIRVCVWIIIQFFCKTPGSHCGKTQHGLTVK